MAHYQIPYGDLPEDLQHETEKLLAPTVDLLQSLYVGDKIYQLQCPDPPHTGSELYRAVATRWDAGEPIFREISHNYHQVIKRLEGTYPRAQLGYLNEHFRAVITDYHQRLRKHLDPTLSWTDLLETLPEQWKKWLLEIDIEDNWSESTPRQSLIEWIRMHENFLYNQLWEKTRTHFPFYQVMNECRACPDTIHFTGENHLVPLSVLSGWGVKLTPTLQQQLRTAVKDWAEEQRDLYCQFMTSDYRGSSSSSHTASYPAPTVPTFGPVPPPPPYEPPVETPYASLHPSTPIPPPASQAVPTARRDPLSFSQNDFHLQGPTCWARFFLKLVITSEDAQSAILEKLSAQYGLELEPSPCMDDLETLWKVGPRSQSPDDLTIDADCFQLIEPQHELQPKLEKLCEDHHFELQQLAFSRWSGNLVCYQLVLMEPYPYPRSDEEPALGDGIMMAPDYTADDDAYPDAMLQGYEVGNRLIPRLMGWEKNQSWTQSDYQLKIYEDLR